MSQSARPAWRRFVVPSIVAGLCVLLVGWASWIVVRGLIVKNELTDMVPIARDLQAEVMDGGGRRDALVENLRSRAAVAFEITHDPLWRITEAVPWLGPNLAAVREVTEIVDVLSTDAADALLEAAQQYDPSALSLVDGAVDLGPIEMLREPVGVANELMSSASSRAGDIDTTSVVGPVRDGVDRLVTVIRDVSDSVDALDRTARLVPSMLGSEGPRTTLILVQNNAELRASGGISGALAVLSTDNGAIALGQQASSGAFYPPFDESVLPLDEATREMYGDITGRYIQDVNLTPWFDTSAQLAKEMWERRFGGDVDAVVGVDPILLSYLLEATGPVAVGDVRLTSENAVQILLSEVYSMYESPPAQDAFFASAAQAVFAAVTGPDVDPRRVIEALVRGGEEHRIRIWSAHPDEQSLIEATTLAGLLPHDNNDGPLLGVFLNDGTGAKMNYYTEVSSTVAMGVCRADGLPTYRVTVTIENAAPADAATSLPWYVTGGGQYGTPPGSIEMFVSAYGPVDASTQMATRDGEAVPVVLADDRGRPVALVSFELAPGESTTYSVEFLGSAPVGGPLQLVLTPTINVIETQHRALGC